MSTRRAHASVLPVVCSLSLSLGPLAGCSTRIANLVTTSSPSQKVSPASGNVAMAESPSAAAQPAPSFVTVTGQVTFHGEPIANAEIRVVDALTDKPAPVIAAGGGNIIPLGGGNVIAPGGANIVAAGGGNLKTDAQGNFRVDLAGLTGGSAARLVVVTGGNALSTLVTGGALAGRAYAVREAQGGIAINEATTTVSHLASGVLRVSRMLKPDAAAPILQAMMAGLQGQLDQYAREFRENPGLSNRMAEETDPLTGGPKARQCAIMGTLLENAGTRKAVFELDKTSLVAIAHAAQDAANQAPNMDQVRTEAQDVPLVGTGLTASVEQTTLSIGTAGGSTVDLSLTDSSALDTTLGSGTFTATFTPPTTGSGGTTTTATAPAYNVGPIHVVAAYPTCSGQGRFTVDGSGHLWMTVPVPGADAVRLFGLTSTTDPAANMIAESPMTAPGAIAFDGGDVWVAQEGPAMVTRFTPSAAAPFFTRQDFAIPAGSSHPQAIAATNPSGSPIVWTADGGTNTLSHYGTIGQGLGFTAGSATDKAYGAAAPESIAIVQNSDATTTVWFLGRDLKNAPALIGFDPNNPSVATATLSLPAGIGHPMHLTRGTNYTLLMTDDASNQVLIYDTVGKAFQTLALPAGYGPGEVVDDGGNYWTLNHGNNTVSVFDHATLSMLGTFPLGFTPGDMADKRDFSNTVYVSDLAGNRIVELNATQTVARTPPSGIATVVP